MRFCWILLASAFLGAALIGYATVARADEGMWLFNYPPKKLLKEKHDFEPTDAWLDALAAVGGAVQQRRLRVVRLGRRPGDDQPSRRRRRLAEAQHQGPRPACGRASTPARRPRNSSAPTSELNVLVSIEDVTERVNAAVKSAADSAEAEKQRRAVMNTIEKESLDQTGLRSDVVTLYQGGLYHLYRYKKYTDVRLVFAPEQDIAFFGGDPDNFEYPRYDLDICFFRVYEDGKPAKPPHYLKWNPAGLKEDDLVFVAGHPGKTDRLNTVRHLEFLRDRVLPASLDVLRRREVLLRVVQPAERRERPAGQGPAVGVPELPQGPPGRAGRLAGPGRDGPQTGRRRGASAGRPPRIRRMAADLRRRPSRRSTKSLAVVGGDPRRLRPAGARPGLPQRVVHHRPHAGAAGRGNRQAQRRPAARVPRVEPRFAQAGAVLRGARSTTTWKPRCWPTR